MTDREALLRSIIENPDWNEPRLVFADYLEGIGEQDRCDFIRVQVELARRGFTPNCPTCKSYGGPCDTCEAIDVEELRRCERELRDVEAAILIESGLAFDHSEGKIPGAYEFLVDDADITRGFVSTVHCSWQDWLSHADSLTWHAGAKDERRESCGWCGASGYQDHHRTCMYCSGAGWTAIITPRPFPATCQPLEQVNLTDWPPMQDFTVERPAQTFYTRGEFINRFDRMKCPKCDGTGMHRYYPDLSGGPNYSDSTDCGQCHGQPLNEWTCETWPGLVFTMPDAAERTGQIPQTGWELEIIHERLDSTDNYSLPTLIRGDMEWRGPMVYGVQAQLGRTFVAQATTRGRDTYTVQAVLTNCELEIIDSDRIPMMRLRARTTGPIGGNR